MDIDVIARLRQKKEQEKEQADRELEALRLVEEMIKRESLSTVQMAAVKSSQPEQDRRIVRPGRPNGNGHGPKTKRQLIRDLMMVRPTDEWTTQEVVQALRENGISAKSSSISGELSRMVRLGDIRLAYRGKDRWDGSKWKLVSA